MPWTLTDYPASMKHLAPLTRKKAIDIANALLADGYSADRALPIATAQAQRWHASATAGELRAFARAADPTTHDPHHHATAREKRLHDAVTEVRPHPDGWAVIARGARRADAIFPRKVDAIARAKTVARNKGAAVALYSRSDDLQRTVTPRPVRD